MKKELFVHCLQHQAYNPATKENTIKTSEIDFTIVSKLSGYRLIFC